MARGMSAVRELVGAVSALAGWGWAGDESAVLRQRRGAGVLAAQSVIMIGVAALCCLGKIAIYGGAAAAGWLAVFVPLALPLALAAALRPPRMALGLVSAAVAGAVAGLLTVLAVHDYVAGFWLAFSGLSVAALVAGTVFGYVTATPARTPE